MDARAPLPFFDRALRAAAVIPLLLTVLLVFETAAYLRFAWLVMSPITWLFAGVIGLPMLYAAEFLIALPLFLALRRFGIVTLSACACAGLLASVLPTWLWSDVIGYGPIPMFRQFSVLILMTAPAGAIGGGLFWKMAVEPTGLAKPESIRLSPNQSE